MEALCSTHSSKMHTTWKNRVFGLEPYEELQSGFVFVEGDSQADALSLSLSPPGMIPSSSQNTKLPKKSLFSRKPVRRTSTDPPPSPTPNVPPPDQPSTQHSPTETLHAPVPVSRDPSLDAQSLNPNRSIIPESLKELPSWYHTEGELAAATTRQFRGRYPIHNPVGPRFYKNVHLLPPNRPASVFSPSFPPMSTEPAAMAAPSRTPSGTPLPTPSSSEIRIPDLSGKVRTRKISNAADNVDLLDASDPYGTNWHHESPYDGLGLGDRNPLSADIPDARAPPRNRSHMSTQGVGSHHRTTAPSPLSQSTSAVHLHSADQDAPPPVAITRRLTKRRKPFEGIFGSSSSAPATDTTSTTSSQTVTSKLFKRQSIFKSASTSSIAQTISNASIVPSEKRQKHSSMLGRFTRRLSIMRRVAPGNSRRGSFDASNDGSRRQSLQVTDRTSMTTRPPSLAFPVSSSENPQSTRVPPPQAATTPSPDFTPLGTPEDERIGEQTQNGKRDSLTSLEAPYSIGRLTVANPDVPSVDDSPVNQSYPLPASRSNPVSASLPPQIKEKPLPPPAPPSSPVFLEVPKFESLSALIPPFNGHTKKMSTVAPATHATPGERQKSQSNPPSSFPVPIPRAVSKSERRSLASSPSSPMPVPASTSVSPPARPSTGRMSISAPPAIDDSPLSRASIIANPPTPYVETTHINNPPLTEQAMAPPPVHLSIPSPVITSIISSPSPHAPSPRESQMTPSHETKNQVSRMNSSVRSRETETFHLVRSPSAGAVQPTGQSIIVAGEQWEVVGGGTQRTRTKKEKEEAKRGNEDRRDGKRQDRMSIEKAPTPAPSKSEARKSRTKEGSSSRHRTSQTEGKDQVRRSPTVPSARASGVPSPKRTPERRPSQSQGPRPTSELTPAADMNALRAREVWEMDRLWKGRSVAYGLGGPQVVYAQSIGDVNSTTSVNGIGHGSAHTSYKLQQGFPFPTGVHSPPSPSSLRPPQPQMQGTLYDFPSGIRSYPDLANIPSIGSPDSTPSTPSRNPLPAPPRQSTYRPGPLPSSLVERDDGAKAEYWSKYAGVGVVSPTH